MRIVILTDAAVDLKILKSQNVTSNKDQEKFYLLPIHLSNRTHQCQMTAL